MDKSKPRLTHSLVEKRAPKKKGPKTAKELREESKKETEASDYTKQSETQATDNYNSNGQLRQQEQQQNVKKPQKSGFVNKAADKIGQTTDKIDNRSKKHLDSSGYGPFNEGVVARGKKYADTQKYKAQEVKDDFENRMNMFRDSAELSARKPPIKQNPGESDLEFRRRQQKEDDNTPENPQRMSLSGAAKQHAKDYGKKQLGKGADFVRKKGGDYLAKNPKTAAALKGAKEKAEAFKKRRSEEIKKLAEKKKKFTDKINKAKTYAKKLKDQLNVKKRLEDELKKRIAQFALKIIWPAIGGILVILAKLFIVVLAVVVVISAVDYTCKSNPLFDAACSVFVDIAL